MARRVGIGVEEGEGAKKADGWVKKWEDIGPGDIRSWIRGGGRRE